MFLVGIAHLAFPAYGADFLRAISSVYPGLGADRNIWGVLLGTVYGIVDGAVAGWIFGMLYRWVAGPEAHQEPGERQSVPPSMPLRRAS
jgi:hypothetical protein